MAAGHRHRQSLQIAMTERHVDNPAGDVKVRRHNKTAAIEIARKIRENEDGGR